MRIRYNKKQLANLPHIPFTYLVRFIHPNTNEALFYYGVRYASHCNPQDLFTTYFTSSSEVHDLIHEYGLDPFSWEIRRIFPANPAGALQWETKVLTRMRAPHRDDFLNRCISGGLFVLKGERNPAYGIPKSDKHKDKISIANKRWALEHPDEVAAQALSMTGENNPMYGKPMLETTKASIRKANLGRKATDEQREKQSKSMQEWVRTHQEEIKEAGIRRRGRVVSEDTRRNMSIARKGVPCPEVLKAKLRLRTGEKSSSWGRKASEETKKLMSDNMKGKYVGEANPCFGRKHTDEERKQMSDVKRRRSEERHGFPLGTFPLTKKCLQCSKDFEVEMKTRRYEFCSPSCGTKHRWEAKGKDGFGHTAVPVDKTCPICSTGFQISSEGRDQTCCSRSCGMKYYWEHKEKTHPIPVDKICVVCKKDFQVPQKHRTQPCCSKDCGSTMRKMKNPNYRPPS